MTGSTFTNPQIFFPYWRIPLCVVCAPCTPSFLPEKFKSAPEVCVRSQNIRLCCPRQQQLTQGVRVFADPQRRSRRLIKAAKSDSHKALCNSVRLCRGCCLTGRHVLTGGCVTAVFVLGGAFVPTNKHVITLCLVGIRSSPAIAPRVFARQEHMCSLVLRTVAACLHPALTMSAVVAGQEG